MAAECSICLENLVGICLTGEEKEVTAVSCGHTYHTHCLLQHLLVSPRCPACSIPTSTYDPSLRKIFISSGENDDEDEEDERTAAIAHLTAENVELKGEKVTLTTRADQLTYTTVQLANQVRMNHGVNIELQRERDTANRRVLELEKKLRVAQSELAKERLAREALEKKYKSLRAKPSASTHSSGGQPSQKRIRLKEPPSLHSTNSLINDSSEEEAVGDTDDEDEDATPDRGQGSKRRAHDLDSDAEDDQPLADRQPQLSQGRGSRSALRVQVFWSGRGHPSHEVTYNLTDTFLVFRASFQAATGLKAGGGFRLPGGEVWTKGNPWTIGQMGVKPNTPITALSCRKVVAR